MGHTMGFDLTFILLFLLITIPFSTSQFLIMTSKEMTVYKAVSVYTFKKYNIHIHVGRIL